MPECAQHACVGMLVSLVEASNTEGRIHAATRSGIGLAAAARIAQAHGGGLDARRTEAGGSTLLLTVRG